MASSKKLPKNSLTTNPSAAFYDELKHFLKQFFRQHQLARPALLIAYSGGLDSTVLLHALRHLQSEIPFHLSAMHIHHGLSGYADDWANFCSETALQLNVPIQIVQVTVDQQSGKGIEAAARHARYQALNTVEADFIFLGHHQDDQAETFLLQLARGAGVKGLAVWQKWILSADSFALCLILSENNSLPMLKRTILNGLKMKVMWMKGLIATLCDTH